VPGANLTAGDQFNQTTVDAGGLVYRHDGSETAADQFAFTLDVDVDRHQVADEWTSPSAQFTFNISVRAVDDRPFHVVTTAPWIRLVQGSTTNITRDRLLTEDDDTPPDRIVYEVNVSASRSVQPTIDSSRS